MLFQSANATAATVQTDKKKAAKAGSKHKVEATADDTEGTSKAVEEPAPESKRASESADYGALQLHEFSQVIPLIYLCSGLANPFMAFNIWVHLSICVTHVPLWLLSTYRTRFHS